MAVRRADATGRSTGRLIRAGKARRWKINDQFIAHTRELRESAGFRALSTPARHVLDFLELEHMNHGGAENGNLLAPFAQLEAWGISNRDIGPAIVMLEAFGIIRRTRHGERLGGRPRASLYALTWLPTADGALPTEEFRKVAASDVTAFLKARATAKARKAKARFLLKGAGEAEIGSADADVGVDGSKCSGDAVRGRAACDVNAAALPSRNIESNPHLNGDSSVHMNSKLDGSVASHSSNEQRIAIHLRGDV